MNVKRIAIIFVIACCLAGLDNLATAFDLEPGEPGYETYGGLGAILFFLALPIMFLKSGVIALIFSGDPRRLCYVFGGGTWGFIWLADIATVFFWAGIFYGLRWVFRMAIHAFGSAISKSK